MINVPKVFLEKKNISTPFLLKKNDLLLFLVCLEKDFFFDNILVSTFHMRCLKLQG